SFGWDVTRNLQIDPTSLPAPTPGNEVIANPDGPYAAVEDTSLAVDAAHGVLGNDLSAGPEIGPASATASKYFLLIDGLDGGSTAAGHVGWFEINSFELDLSHAVGTAAATFSPLVVDLNLNPALAGVLKDIAAGSLIKSIKIEGV